MMWLSTMNDLFYLFLTAGFFAAAALYTHRCENL